jgi:hypothetical protein
VGSEDYGDMFLRNVCFLSTDYTTIYLRRLYFSVHFLAYSNELANRELGVVCWEELVPCFKLLSRSLGEGIEEHHEIYHSRYSGFGPRIHTGTCQSRERIANHSTTRLM